MTGKENILKVNVTCCLILGHQYLGEAYCTHFFIFYMEEE